MVFSSESETNPHVTVAVLMFLDSVGSLYRVTNGVIRSCAILSKKVFPFYLLLRLIFEHVVCIYDQCIYCSNVDHAIKHCHCPSGSCSLYCVPCKHLIQRATFVLLQNSMISGFPESLQIAES